MNHRITVIYAWIWVFILCLAAPAGAENLSAEVRVAQEEALVGEPVTLQIVVSGSESPSQPDLSHIDGASVAFQGGSQNSSRSISIINGRMAQNVQEGYVFSYQITPLREGRIEIPAISVSDNGRTAVTRPVFILAKKPAESESDGFKLRMALSKTACYVGEPVILTVTWYLSGDVESASFSIPFLENKDRFFVSDPKTDTRSGKQYYRIPTNSGEVIVEKGQGELDGRAFSTLSFQKVLIPSKSGRISIDPVTVSYKSLTGYRNRRFDDEFFSNFFNQSLRQGIYKQGVAPSNSLELTVKDLPATGRPANFSGLVGTYHIEAEASPTTVNVGDPITLTVAVSGPEFLEPVMLPPLQKQPDIIKNFKVPSEMAAGEISGDRKIFTQTIRPLRADVTAVPPILLSYFDTRTGTYETAHSAPIPLSVSLTRMVTAKDAEGRQTSEPSGARIETWTAGIAHNYDDASVLVRQAHDPVMWARSPAGIASLALPPGLYLLLFTGTWVYRKKKTDPGSSLARKAGALLAREIQSAGQNGSPDQAMADILTAFKAYLRAKLRLQPGVLTFHDVAEKLSRKGIDPETLAELQSLFAEGEAARYGNAGHGKNAADAAKRASHLLKQMEKLL
ncbi:MAG: BatD family protein [Desulfobacteraceae bacterium]|nr:BatD family protein [Desulfobacteraceae bacterium]